MRKISIPAPRAITVPRGAIWAGLVVEAAVAIATRLRAAATAAITAGRERRDVERAARQRARDRSELMLLARRYETSQPEFAKDLYAAARRDA